MASLHFCIYFGGVDRPTSGKVFIDGKDIYKYNDDELAIFRRRQVRFDISVL